MIDGLLQGKRPSIVFIRSLSVLAFVAIGPRRGPTMFNRMCSEAELAVAMWAIISSSKRANATLQFAPFGDGLVSFALPQVPFPSVIPHAVKHSSPPSGTGLTPIRYTPELRMNPFAVQSAVRACGMSASRPGNHERAHPSHWLVSMPYSRWHSMPRQPENLVPAPPRWTEKHQP